MRDYELDDERLDQLLSWCTESGRHVCGLDEAGRGALAGPVVAAAVVLRGPAPLGLGDSKVLTAKRRDRVFAELAECAVVGVGIVDVDIIDRVNILQANFLAMQLAWRQVRQSLAVREIDSVVVDGNHLTDGIRTECAADGVRIFAMVKGDSKVAAISAASVVAKVTRDRLMRDLDPIHPGYGFAGNAGYGSPAHLEGLKRLGASSAHRRSFAPVAAVIATTVS